MPRRKKEPFDWDRAYAQMRGAEFITRRNLKADAEAARAASKSKRPGDKAA